ncbi:polyhydroxyalkanoate granule-associated protein PhaI [Pseudomonas amygdali pv. mori str. 301020]|uniref:Polyhydroxyalkanoate granule-associated protein PhaI n=1 Tax=Pseudomonas amygdali pv. mori str. 301020 TaxID=629261 RepID=A0A656GJ69_PSEA0|nr:polyhydroxyalkanoate granule-associated protein PhaI [Pseudomonas amygdali pv. mori str. 301020]
MARANTKKNIEDQQSSTLSDVRLYARKIWLAGLGAYSRVNEEGTQYVRDLIRTGEQAGCRSNGRCGLSQIVAGRDEWPECQAIHRGHGLPAARLNYNKV